MFCYFSLFPNPQAAVDPPCDFKRRGIFDAGKDIVGCHGAS